MKRSKKIISLFLSGCICLSLMAGCTSGKDKTKESQAAASKTAVTQKGPSYSWDTSPWEIDNWYVGFTGYAKEWDIVNNQNDKISYEKTGLKKVTFSTSPSKADEKLNAMIAANNLPDVITILASGNTEKIDLLQSGGLVEDLFALMDKYAPTFKPEIPKGMSDWWKAPDGKWYAFPNSSISNREVKETAKVINTHLSYARKDIMEKLGIKPEDFKTQDGTVAALKKFKDSGITQNGAPMLPVIMHPMEPPYDYITGTAAYFGIMHEDSAGNYIVPVNNPKFWEMTRFLNRLYREGLFTDTNLLMRKKEGDETAANSKYFYTFGHSSYLTSDKAVVKATNGQINYVPVDQTRSKDGMAPFYATSSAGSAWTLTFISKSAKNKERIIRFLEYKYSTEGQMQEQFGTEGVTYEKVGNQYKLTDAYQAELSKDRVAAEKKYGMRTMWMVRDTKFTESITYQIPKNQLPVELLMEREISDYFKNIVMVNDCVNNLVVAPNPGTEESDISAKITIYMDQQLLKMISAKTEADFETLYKETMSQVEKLGVKKLSDAQNKKFQDIKKKLGVQFSYPQLQKK